ncbi:MAG: hypothetical protein LW720_10735 [Pirellula sp.]|jgi:hypothetical protein|nr:hypothetical protein [Pirellula sp.]
MSVKAEDILQSCSVTGNPRVFLLPTSERPSRILSQQRRALNIVQSMYQCGILGARGLAVVGAGFGGLTAGCYAAINGTRVTFIERGRPLQRFSRSNRYLHPHLYDWPKQGWDDKHARLPVLNWTAGEAWKVTNQVLTELEIVQTHFDVQLECDAKIEEDGVRGSRDTAFVKWKCSDEREMAEAFDAVLIAIGFGVEQSRPEVLRLRGWSNFPQYWDIDPPSLSVEPNANLFVLGSGDGALADLIGLAALADKRLTDNHRKSIYYGDFADELSKLPSNKLEEVARVENRILELRAAGTTPNSREYQDKIIRIVGRDDGLFLAASAKSATIVGRNESLDVAGTYAANRFLFLMAYRNSQVQYEKSFSEVRWPKPNYSVTSKRANIGEFNGPFQCIGPNDWLLERPGPADVLQKTFPNLARTSANPSLRALALTERPISAAWSQCTAWENFRLDETATSDKSTTIDRPEALPRLSLSTEWADSVIQKLLSILAKNMPNGDELALSFLTGMLRVYALIFERIQLTDANLLDGVFLTRALLRLDATDRIAFTAFCRNQSFPASTIQFLTKKTQRGLEIGSMHLSTAWEDSPKVPVGKLIRNKSESARMKQLRSIPAFHGVIENLDRLTSLQENGPRIVSTTTGLWSLIPQSGLLDALAGQAILKVKTSGLLPKYESVPNSDSFTSPVLPGRTAVFQHLKELAEAATDPFASDKPEWLSTVASWYNAAYNTAIARKNGATACDLLWVNPVHSFKKTDVTVAEIQLRDIGNLSKKNWANLRKQIAPNIIRWRQGESSLLKALSPILGETGDRRPPSSSNLHQRLQGALKETIEIGELRNPERGEFSSQRAIVFYLRGPGTVKVTPLSSILIG